MTARIRAQPVERLQSLSNAFRLKPWWQRITPPDQPKLRVSGSQTESKVSEGEKSVLNTLDGISIIIPAYNERLRLGPTLDRVLSFVHEQAWDAEVIVVDDGSDDGTPDIVRSYSERNPRVHLAQNPGNRGKGYSVRNGVLNARGAIVLFTDADLSSPIEEALKLLDAIEAGADVAIGSRWMRSELQTR